jgi:penicillin-binding protein 1B
VAVKVQVPKKTRLLRFLVHPAGKAVLAVVLLLAIAFVAVFSYTWVKYSKLINAKLGAGPFANTSMLFAAPTLLSIGDEATPEQIATELHRGGYTESSRNPLGYYTLGHDEIDVYPGPDSMFDPEGGVIKFGAGKVTQIISLRDNTPRTQYQLEPDLISNLFDKNREKRRLVRFQEIPPVLVDAVISIEDKRFFQHSGFDPFRIIKAAFVDIRSMRNKEGASTLSQQLARGFWLTRDKTWGRKLAEVIITLQLEQRLTKQQIFEYYANQVDLGRRGSFGIRGFGEAAEAYFGKNISRLTIPEAATIAGLIQRPSYTNPFHWPDRARQRRNLVLLMMRDNDYITPQQYEEAVASPLVLAKPDMESTDAPYFVDAVNDWLLDKFQERDFQTTAYRVYTTLDMSLQHDASEAVRAGMEEVDKLVAPRRKKDPSYPSPQCTLIAIDPHTGEIKAFIGGRNYGQSQLDRLVSKRQPGSVFKPFVYAAALNTGLGGASTVFTPVSTFNDEPTTFWYDDKPYEPGDFKNEYHGIVSLRQALAHSMNIPTVALAEKVGYGAVVDLARKAGMNLDIRPTPAVALGAYDVTPIEIAGAYTIYANHGVYVKPHFITSIRDDRSEEIFRDQPETRPVLDPRVAFMMDSLLEEVLRTGTGAGVRGRGFGLPAAGKTGTSRDGWFAGFTSKLLCVVWVGFDDHRELNIEGAKSALPVWTEFMKRAHQHREYRNVTGFTPPAGIVSVEIDPESGELATSNCPVAHPEYFIEGTQPVEACHLHGGGAIRIAGWDSPASSPGSLPAPGGSPRQTYTAVIPTPPGAKPAEPPPAEPKKGFFSKLKEIFKK